jgi:hypothetical protein
MRKKNKYHSLDDIGFIGVAEKRSEKDIEKDAKLTSEVIKKFKSAKSNTKSAAAGSKKAAKYKSTAAHSKRA